jgi:hypothetical protein
MMTIPFDSSFVPATNINWTLPPLVISCVTNKFVYLVMLKNWGDEKTRQGLTDIGGGSTWGAPANQELTVAFPILGKEDEEEELRSNTLTMTQFQHLLLQLRSLNNLDKESF